MRSKAEYFPVFPQGRMAGFLYIMEKKCTYLRKLNDSNIKHNDNNLNGVLRISNYIDVVGNKATNCILNGKQTGIEVLNSLFTS